ncbi:unnamed protein product [Polarella glacialis]|uniref:Fatty acid hydroxylase domain-containing protein n=1 Tax=Polarella glacialis TaxID=89957 RepID=A0A813LF77_POLGL|nr:unnamed protein product [Polarella glacialis]
MPRALYHTNALITGLYLRNRGSRSAHWLKWERQGGLSGAGFTLDPNKRFVLKGVPLAVVMMALMCTRIGWQPDSSRLHQHGEPNDYMHHMQNDGADETHHMRHEGANETPSVNVVADLGWPQPVPAYAAEQIAAVELRVQQAREQADSTIAAVRRVQMDAERQVAGFAAARTRAEELSTQAMCRAARAEVSLEAARAAAAAAIRAASEAARAETAAAVRAANEASRADTAAAIRAAREAAQAEAAAAIRLAEEENALEEEVVALVSVIDRLDDRIEVLENRALERLREVPSSVVAGDGPVSAGAKEFARQSMWNCQRSDNRQAKSWRSGFIGALPSADERKAHEVTHLPYQQWCPVCVSCKAADSPHHRLPKEGADGTPVVEFDYGFVSPTGQADECEAPVVLVALHQHGEPNDYMHHMQNDGADETHHMRHEGANETPSVNVAADRGWPQPVPAYAAEQIAAVELRVQQAREQADSTIAAVRRVQMDAERQVAGFAAARTRAEELSTQAMCRAARAEVSLEAARAAAAATIRAASEAARAETAAAVRAASEAARADTAAAIRAAREAAQAEAAAAIRLAEEENERDEFMLPRNLRTQSQKMAAPALSAARAAHEVFCWMTVLTACCSISLGGAAGFALQCVLGVASVWIDWRISPTTEANLSRLAAHGYGRHSIMVLMLVNLVSTNALVALIAAHFQCFEAPLRLDGALAAAVGTNLVASELAFTAGHYLLHKSCTLAPFHVLHHCCRPCSWSSNLLFHPLDMAIEFTGPFFVLLATHRLIWRDPLALLVSLTVLHTWYAVDHSENARLYHYYHHKHIDAVYTIYIRVRFGPRGETAAAAESERQVAGVDQVKLLLKKDAYDSGIGDDVGDSDSSSGDEAGDLDGEPGGADLLKRKETKKNIHQQFNQATLLTVDWSASDAKEASKPSAPAPPPQRQVLPAVTPAVIAPVPTAASVESLQDASAAASASGSGARWRTRAQGRQAAGPQDAENGMAGIDRVALEDDGLDIAAELEAVAAEAAELEAQLAAAAETEIVAAAEAEAAGSSTWSGGVEWASLGSSAGGAGSATAPEVAADEDAMEEDDDLGSAVVKRKRKKIRR